MGLPVKQAERSFTYADYLRWDDGERWELIDGVAYNMTPAPTTSHQTIVGNLFTQLSVYLKGKPCRPFVAPFDVRLGDADDDDDVVTVVQPDIVVVCDPNKLDERGCRGAPDFVVEVASPSTAARDQIQKTRLYERHGVKEFWVVHPTDRLVYVRILGADGTFAPLVVVAGEGTLAVRTLPGLEIDLDDVFEGTTPP